jgi:hypothetical protein
MIARTHIKSVIVRVLAALNRMDLLLARRNRAIEDDVVKHHFENEITQILNTVLPA